MLSPVLKPFLPAETILSLIMGITHAAYLPASPPMPRLDRQPSVTCRICHEKIVEDHLQSGSFSLTVPGEWRHSPSACGR
jgi:hypothetical protein